MASKEILDKLIAQPDSLKAERVGEEFMINDTRGDTLPNTGNLSTFLLLQNFYKGDTAADKNENDKKLKNISRAVDEENKYLLEAVDILNGELPSDASQTQIMAIYNIRSKYGKGIEGAAILSNLLRRKANELEFDLLVNPLVAGLVSKDIVSRRQGVWGSDATAAAAAKTTATEAYRKLYTGL